MALGNDKDFVEDYKRITGEEPDHVAAEEVEKIFDRIRNIDPEVKRVLKESVGEGSATVSMSSPTATGTH